MSDMNNTSTSDLMSCDVIWGLNYGLLSSINLYIAGILLPLISVFGVVSNILNLVVFIKQGLGDGPTILLFFLSLTDLAQLLFTLIFGMCMLCHYFDLRLKHLDPFTFALISSTWQRTMFADMTMLTTMVVAVERCLCVVKPFAVRTLMTRRRTILIVTLIPTLCISCYAPIISSQWLSWQPTSQEKNRTQLVWSIDEPRYRAAEKFISVFNNITLNTVSQAVVIFATSAMIIGLRRASTFRGRVGASTSLNKSSNKKEADEISQKDMNLIKSVLVISIMFVLCNTPTLLTVYAQLIEPALREGGCLEPLLAFLYGIICFCTGVSASTNLIIYYNLSGQYRRLLRDMCCHRPKQHKKLAPI